MMSARPDAGLTLNLARAFICGCHHRLVGREWRWAAGSAVCVHAGVGIAPLDEAGEPYPIWLGAGVVVALAPMGETRTMPRAMRRHRSYRYARRAQRTHLRQA